ncbi:hypothetical protein INR49_006374 [Caranx melampygus]|nr:hypothetical protein INR49_006374 [Caranx melampygus]
MHLTPTWPAANSHVAGSRVEASKGGEAAGEEDPRLVARPGLSGEEEEEEEEKERGRGRGERGDAPTGGSLRSSIQSGLDPGTHCSTAGYSHAVLEERLTLTEDKLKECLAGQSRILKDVRASRARRRMDSEETDRSPDRKKSETFSKLCPGRTRLSRHGGEDLERKRTSLHDSFIHCDVIKSSGISK